MEGWPDVHHVGLFLFVGTGVRTVMVRTRRMEGGMAMDVDLGPVRKKGGILGRG